MRGRVWRRLQRLRSKPWSMREEDLTGLRGRGGPLVVDRVHAQQVVQAGLQVGHVGPAVQALALQRHCLPLQLRLLCRAVRALWGVCRQGPLVRPESHLSKMQGLCSDMYRAHEMSASLQFLTILDEHMCNSQAQSPDERLGNGSKLNCTAAALTPAQLQAVGGDLRAAVVPGRRPGHGEAARRACSGHGRVGHAGPVGRGVCIRGTGVGAVAAAVARPAAHPVRAPGPQALDRARRSLALRKSSFSILRFSWVPSLVMLWLFQGW